MSVQSSEALIFAAALNLAVRNANVSCAAVAVAASTKHRMPCVFASQKDPVDEAKSVSLFICSIRSNTKDTPSGQKWQRLGSIDITMPWLA